MNQPKAIIIADSITENNHRILTFSLTFHRFILPEVNTHRMAVHSSESSRARPLKQMRSRVRNASAEPLSWGVNGKGMVATGELSGWRRSAAQGVWRAHRWSSLSAHWALDKLGAHKQVTNRVIEPHNWQEKTLTISEISLNHLFALRCHPDAQPEFQALANAMRSAYEASGPILIHADEWHTPYTSFDECGSWDTAVRVSVARCARASYGRSDDRPIAQELALYNRLAMAKPPHAGPFEHVATPDLVIITGPWPYPSHGPLLGWQTWRSYVMEGFEK